MNYKKILGFSLALGMLFNYSFFCNNTFAYDEALDKEIEKSNFSLNTLAETDIAYAVKGGNIYFDSATGTITACDKSVTSVDIPKQIEGVAVTHIGDKAFYNCRKLSSLTIPNSVTHIGNYSFEDCVNLKALFIPNSVISIGSWTFLKCSSLTDVNIPTNIEFMGTSTFCDCTSLKTITIPDNAVNIPPNSFYGCTSLSSITIPNSILSIGRYAFYGCTSLKSIKIPNNVTSIDLGAFSECTNLSSIELSNKLDNISGYAFSDCPNLKNIKIPDSVTYIGAYAFLNCTGLTDIKIPNNLTIICDYTFSNCTGLKNVELSNNTTLIGNYAFSGCTGLSSIDLPNSLTSILDYAFSDCTGLSAIDFPDKFNSMGKYAFSNCTGLKTIKFSDKLTSIGDCAFLGCNALSEVYYSGSKENWKKIAENHTELLNANLFCGKAILSKFGNKIYIDNETITKFVITNNKDFVPTEYNGAKITSIDENAFYPKNNNNISIVIPNEITSISSKAFDLCDKAKFVIYAQKGSVAEQYANDNSIPLEYVNLNFESENSKKDTNGDGKLTLEDSEAHIKMVLNNDRLNSVIDLMGNSYKTFLDLDNDGIITASDSAIILK